MPKRTNAPIFPARPEPPSDAVIADLYARGVVLPGLAVRLGNGIVRNVNAKA